MMQNNIHTDIKESIIRNFSFLKSYGFKDFEENQLAYETHFKTENDAVTIDIWFEAIPSTPIWIKINEYYLDNLELENLILKNYEKQRSEKYDELFQSYLKKDDSAFLEKIQDAYHKDGKKINELYLNESSEIIKRNIEILSGDLEILKSNTEIVINKNEQLKSNERIKNKTYTLEYQFFPEGSIDDAYEEFSSLEELNDFLNEKDEIVKYRVLDWNMTVVKQT